MRYCILICSDWISSYGDIYPKYTRKPGLVSPPSLLRQSCRHDEFIFDPCNTACKYENMTEEQLPRHKFSTFLQSQNITQTWRGLVSLKIIKMKNWRTLIEIKAVGDWQKRKSITYLPSWSVVISSQTHWKLLNFDKNAVELDLNHLLFDTTMTLLLTWRWHWMRSFLACHPYNQIK